MLERYLVLYCAPTLASLKTASLFCLPQMAEDTLRQQIDLWNRQLEAKGLSVLVLKKREDRSLIYVYRKSHLQADLHKPGVAAFLRQYGYSGTDFAAALSILQQRLAESEDFPHEIGLFLGYPLTDVVGFIENDGKNCKCAGCWKVYGNECEALKQFARFKKCREVYTRLWQQGKTIGQLTVAV